MKRKTNISVRDNLGIRREISMEVGSDGNYPSGDILDANATSQLIQNEIGQHANNENLAPVATSGSYNDLSDKPMIPSLDGYINGVTYDSQTKRINFKHDDTLITYIDATSFVVDGMVDTVEINNRNLVVTWNVDSGKQTISIPLTDIFDPENYYTKTAVDSALGTKANVASLAVVATSGSYNDLEDKLQNLQESRGGNDLSVVSTGEKYNWNSKQDSIVNGGTIGFGYGTCSTSATVAEKTVNIPNFQLLVGGIVSVFFNAANSATNATLNVNSTGAKPILINGYNIQPGVIKACTTVQLQYDGSAFNVVGMFGLEQLSTDSSLYVDMGLPSGTLWATANIDITTQSGFQEVDGAVSPYKYECSLFSWGNTDGHNPSSTSAFDYDWGGVNAEEPWYDGQVYDNTPGNTLTGNIPPSMDAARVNLGAPWRMPSMEDFSELFANIDYIDADGNIVTEATSIAQTAADKRVTVNGINGLYLRSKINGNRLFFPASGYGNGRSWDNRTGNGYFWSSTFNSARNARYLNFNPNGVNPTNTNNRYNGFAVRPVQ